MIFENNDSAQTVTVTYFQFFQAQLCTDKWDKKAESVLVWRIKNSLHIIYHIVITFPVVVLATKDKTITSTVWTIKTELNFTVHL